MYSTSCDILYDVFLLFRGKYTSYKIYTQLLLIIISFMAISTLGCFLSSKIFPTSCYSLPDVTDFPEIGVYHPPGVWVLAPISFQPTIDNIKWITKRVHDFICMSYFEYFLYYGDTISNASTK